MRRTWLASPAVAPGVARPLSRREIHKRVRSIRTSDWRRKIMIFAFFAAKGLSVAEKLVSSISLNCHFTAGRQHPALHPQAVDVIVADSDQEPGRRQRITLRIAI
jgi:hypothetical protein